MINKKTSLKEIENRIISVTEDIEYTSDLKIRKELDNLEQKEKQNFVPSLINKYNVLINKKTNSPEKKPIQKENKNKTNIFKKFLNKNLKKRRQTEGSVNVSVKFSGKVNEIQTESKASSKHILEKNKDESSSNLTLGQKKLSEKIHLGVRSSPGFKQAPNSDIHSLKGAQRRISALDIKEETEDYQIPSEEVIKNQTKMPFKSKQFNKSRIYRPII